ncbi:MAG: methyltransferase domain-containing protein [Desulfovibrio desulfuricans]|nr:methyltransferase domain-containing protein [Desulfovibrio desulfuricans]
MPTSAPTPAASAPPPLEPQAREELDALLARIRMDFDVEFEPLHVDDRPLEVLAIRNMQAHLDKLLQRRAIQNPLKDLPLWAKIWPGSFVLGRLLRKYEPEGKSLLELGAGCGVLSLVAARFGFGRIVLTDVVEEALRFARANVLRNGLAGRVAVTRLDVTAPGRDPRFPDGFDRIAASEMLYLDELHRPLVRFVDRHLAPGGKAFFCTDIARAKPRFAKLAAGTFRVTEGHIGVTAHDEDGGEQRRIYSILILERP